MICANTVKLWTSIPFSVVCARFMKVLYLYIKLKRTFPKNLMQRRSHPSGFLWDVDVQTGSSRSTERAQGLATILLRATCTGDTPGNLICWKTPSRWPRCCGAARTAGLRHPCAGAGGCPGAVQVVMVQQSSS